jgi:hypothetical protein
MRGSSFRLSPYARGGAKGGCYRRKDGDGEVQDFLPNVFAHFDFLYFSSADFADNADFLYCFLLSVVSLFHPDGILKICVISVIRG